jgi:tetratricopeptide (TPR) repeat protein
LNEMMDLAKRYREIQSAGVEIVALSVDGLNEDDGSTPGADKAFCKQRNIPFAVGKASSALTACIMWYHHSLVVMNLQLPIPLSVLVNAQGQMTDIYKGKVTVDELLRDAKRRPASLYERRLQAQCFPGTMLDHEGLMHSHRLMEANTYFTIGNSYAQDQLDEMAIDYFRLALESDPNYIDAYKELAVVLDRLGRESEALMYLSKAVKQKPEHAVLHATMGDIHFKKGRILQARASYLEALRLNPNLEQAKKQLTKLSLQLRR